MNDENLVAMLFDTVRCGLYRFDLFHEVKIVP